MSTRNAKEQSKQGVPYNAALVGTAAWIVLDHLPPLVDVYVIHASTALATGICLICATKASTWFLKTLADGLTWLAARLPRGDKGSARFAKSLRELKGDVITYSGLMPYWAMFKDKAVHAGFSSVAYVLGGSGSGKTARFLINFILSLAGVHNKIIFDLKPEIAVMVIDALVAADEEVAIINFTNQKHHILSKYEVTYNALNVIADLFWRKGGLQDVSDVTQQLCSELYAEPHDSGNDKYWRDGSRRILGFALLCRIILDGYEAAVGDAQYLLSMRDDLLHYAKWIAGKLEIKDKDGKITKGKMPIENSLWCSNHSKEDVDIFCAWFRSIAASITHMMEIPDARTFESYLNGALNSLESFNRTTRAYQITKNRSTYRFSNLKEGDQVKTVIVMMDINKLAAQEAPFRAIRWGLEHEIKNHPNRDKLVYVVADEAVSLPWGREVGKLATFCRGFGLRLLFAFQNYPAVEDGLGKSVCEIIKSEAEIVLLMPNQRNDSTIDYWQKMLGQTSYISKNNSGTRDEFEVKGFSYHEDDKPVMDYDRLRRNDKGLLMIRNHRVLEVDLPFYWEIDPFKRMVGQSPSHKKTPRARTKLRIRKIPLILRFIRWLKRGRV